MGIGAGWDAEKYLDFGYDLRSPLERIPQLEDALKSIKLMFTQDGPSYSGKYYSITDIECYPEPMRKLYPPIMIDGTGEKQLLKVVAKHADIYK